MISVEKYEEISPDWAKTINAALSTGEGLEDLVFVQQEDGSLELFGASLPSVEKRQGHCIIVLNVEMTDEGPAVDVIYATPTHWQSAGAG